MKINPDFGVMMLSYSYSFYFKYVDISDVTSMGYWELLAIVNFIVSKISVSSIKENTCRALQKLYSYRL